MRPLGNSQMMPAARSSNVTSEMMTMRNKCDWVQPMRFLGRTFGRFSFILFFCKHEDPFNSSRSSTTTATQKVFLEKKLFNVRMIFFPPIYCEIEAFCEDVFIFWCLMCFSLTILRCFPKFYLLLSDVFLLP